MAHRGFSVEPIVRAGRGRVGVIDLGSNSIRLVVYEALCRAPIQVFNEKVLCGLGRDLASSGRLHPGGVDLALDNLSRFRRLLEGMNVRHVDVLATAAVRDATDGPAFVETVSHRCELPVTVIGGAEEARLSALGVLSGGLGSDGVMGDLGGGSLEMVGLDGGSIAEQVTLPLGPFRLMEEKGRERARAVVAEAFAGQPWLSRYKGRDFYPVGGSWRAIAKIDMARRGNPVHIIHHYTVPGEEIRQLAQLISRQGKASLERMPGVARRRLETLPHAALVLEGLIAALKPARIVFSAFGLREGHLFDLLPREERDKDPLLEGCAEIAHRLERFGQADLLDAWIGPLFPGERAAAARLRRAAALLSDIGWSEHPDYRAEHAYLRALRLPVAGIDHVGRAWLASALYARYGGPAGDAMVEQVATLLSAEAREQAALVGLALRLGHTLTGGAVAVLERTSLELAPGAVILWLPADEAWLAGDAVQRRLDAVARLMGREGRIAVAPDAGRTARAG